MVKELKITSKTKSLLHLGFARTKQAFEEHLNNLSKMQLGDTIILTVED